MLEHINEISGLPVIGREYRVSCITYKVPETGYVSPYEGNVYENIPVIGALHADKFFFDVDWYHIHFDARFINGDSEKWINYYSPHDDRKDGTRILTVAAIERGIMGETYERILPCIRQMPIFKFNLCDGMVVPLQEKLPKNKRKLSKCNRCPHRGTPLNGMQISDKGIVVCPAHGLAFDTKTREMVLRNSVNTLDIL